MKKVVLLNPPSEKLCIRDYYCSKISQANYISQPIDFVIMSAFLKTARVETFLIDSVVKKYSSQKTMSILKNIKPDIIVTLSGTVSWEKDKVFLEQIKNIIETKILVTGDIFLENPQYFVDKFKFIDGIITDFTSDEILKYINGSEESFTSIVYKKNGKIIKSKPYSTEDKTYNFSTPPMHELFLQYKYRYPFTLTSKYCSVLTEFGCPFKCSFCIMGKLKYKYRSVENVITELKYIKSLGVKEIFFVDQAFCINRPRTKKLLEEIVKEKLNILWFTFSRVDLLDEEILVLMKQAGCHTLILGIESGSDMMLKQYRKGYDKKRIVVTMDICKKLRIRIVGTFIIGLPEETKQTATETLEFIKLLPLDYASFNVAVPRPGTDLRKEAIENNLTENDNFTMDQSGSEIAMPTKHLSQQEVRKIRQKMVRTFYLRPGYIIKRILNLKTFYELYQNILNAYYLIKRTW